MHLSGFSHIPKASALSPSSCTNQGIQLLFLYNPSCFYRCQFLPINETKGNGRIEIKVIKYNCFTLNKLKNTLQYWCSGGEIVNVNAGNTTNGVCNFREVIWHYIAGTISDNYYYESLKRINKPLFLLQCCL